MAGCRASGSRPFSFRADPVRDACHHPAMTTFPLWLKIFETSFVVVLVVIYARTWGWANFLWFSDIALIGSVPALWLEDPLLTSAMALLIVVPDSFWGVSYLARLATGRRISGLSDYMFDATKPRWLRALSLFHLWLPLLLLSMVMTLGYRPEALAIVWIGGYVVLWICRRFTDPAENINWAFGLGGRPSSGTTSLRPFALTLAALPLVVWVPTHFLLEWVG